MFYRSRICPSPSPTGEGAGRNTRGRVCSLRQSKGALRAGRFAGPFLPGAIHMPKPLFFCSQIEGELPVNGQSEPAL